MGNSLPADPYRHSDPYSVNNILNHKCYALPSIVSAVKVNTNRLVFIPIFL